MTLKGHVENGVIVIDDNTPLPEGTPVTIEVSVASDSSAQKREGGFWKGRVEISDDFNELPEDIANAFGMHDK